MSADLLECILQAARVGESADWEFKSARGGFPGNFWETYSASDAEVADVCRVTDVRPGVADSPAWSVSPIFCRLSGKARP